MKFAMPLQVQAYETMKNMIVNGEFQPRTIYSETKTSQQLGISRTPMRDAIQRLAQEGYLDVIPSKGFRIHELTEQDLVETCQTRCALEGFCVVQLAKNIESGPVRRTLHALEALLQEQRAVMESTHSIEEFARYDAEFHEQIVYSLNNSTISEVFDSLHYQMRQQTTLSLAQKGRMEATLTEHQIIVENIRAGAVYKSYEATVAHLEKPKGIIHLSVFERKSISDFA